MTVSSERSLGKNQVKRKRRINPARKQKAYERYLKRNKTKTRRNRLADERYSELSLTVSDQMNKGSGFHVEVSANLKPTPASFDTLGTIAAQAPSNHNLGGGSPPNPSKMQAPTACPPLDPPTTSAARRITWSKRSYKKLELYPHMLGGSPNRRPTPTELTFAETLASKFKLFDSGKVVLLDRKQKSNIIAVIEFTPLEDITPSERDGINKLTHFLSKAKAFVHPVKAPSRSWGGTMFAIGWRKCMEAFELIGRYCNKKAIRQAPNDYDLTMRSSRAASDVLGQMFERLANVALEENQAIMKENHIPGFACLEFDAPLNEFDCAPNLTWTENQFYNQPHKDSKDVSDFALAVFIPISKKTGELAYPGENYDVTGGRFVFPDHKCGIDFGEKGLVKMVWRAREYRHCTLPCKDTQDHTRLAMSLQINQKTATTSKDIEDGSIHERPANKLKNPSDMFVGGHAHLMGDASDSGLDDSDSSSLCCE